MVIENTKIAGERGHGLVSVTNLKTLHLGYFRTLETWKLLFISNVFTINEIIEPFNKKIHVRASIIFVGEKIANKSLNRIGAKSAPSRLNQR